MGITPTSTTYPYLNGASYPPRKKPLAFGEEAYSPINPAVAYRSEAQPASVKDMLVDPITRKKYGIESAFDDKLLRLNAWEKLKLNSKETFVTLPKNIYLGLKGDPHFTFSDYLNVTSVPYYLGGAVLALSFRAGRDKIGFARQAVGVGLYYAGVMAANKGIDAFYKARTGVDLNLKFCKANGDIEKVFASTDFPRTDLLKAEDHRKLMKKMGIPHDVADPKREIQDNLQSIISGSRADKLILGNILAAIGAGYIARSDAWGNVFKGWGNLKNVWDLKNKKEGPILERIANTGTHLNSKIADAVKEAFYSKAGDASAKYFRYATLGGAASLVALIGAHGWITSNRMRKRYESPFITNLSPALAPEQSASTAALQQQLPGGSIDKLPRKGVFAIAQKMELGQPAPPPGLSPTFQPMPALNLPATDNTVLGKGGLILPQGGNFR